MLAPSSLEQRLLHDRIPDDDQPGRRWSASRRTLLVLSLFIAYHLLAVLAHSLPAPGARPLRAWLARVAETESYLGATGISWSWGVFAPDPPRRNLFTRVVVVDGSGQEWDLGHDIVGRRAYPYLVYDRMAKINRQMLRQKQYLLPYAGWVCREWERGHGGEGARTVRLLPIYSRIPAPEVAYRTMGYSPAGLNVEEALPEIFECPTIPHGQLPPRLRARLGLPPQGTAFREVARRSWAARGTPGSAEVVEASGPPPLE
ncbi:MAG TPA: hypothetical protein VJU81_07250 [Methylomirabilota bacterium]|nr:hypothetical protein [Methylomirabilota bacterium]